MTPAVVSREQDLVADTFPYERSDWTAEELAVITKMRNTPIWRRPICYNQLTWTAVYSNAIDTIDTIGMTAAFDFYRRIGS